MRSAFDLLPQQRAAIQKAVNETFSADIHLQFETVPAIVSGIELSAAIDAYAGGRGIRDAQGAWGVLTSNIITRQEAFRIAAIHAFAPFFNASLYPGLESRG